MAKMTYTEKERRREARREGERAKLYIGHMQHDQHQADYWLELATKAEVEPKSARVWRSKADRNEREAIAYARKAAHYARQAQAAAAAGSSKG